MTLEQALHILLMFSANDVANLIADNLGGSVDGFIEMMNEEAVKIGATNTHFSNAHGLTQDNHYTTAYDMYLIFNEALKYDIFKQIIHMTSYDTVYKDSQGRDKEVSVISTNRYFKGDFNPPEKVTVMGGKTGTTNAAGHCLAFSCQRNGRRLIGIVTARELLISALETPISKIMQENAVFVITSL